MQGVGIYILLLRNEAVTVEITAKPKSSTVGAHLLCLTAGVSSGCPGSRSMYTTPPLLLLLLLIRLLASRRAAADFPQPLQPVTATTSGAPAAAAAAAASTTASAACRRIVTKFQQTNKTHHSNVKGLARVLAM
jgi:hypothetical protein